MGLFSKKKKITEQGKPVETVPAAQTKINLPSKPTERKYFEIWGDSLKELDFFKTLTIALVGLCIFLTVVTVRALKKMPLVIRVDQLGHATAVENVKSNQVVSEIEIFNFAQHFLQNFIAWNVYTCDDDFEKAFKMMSLECQDKMNTYLTSNNIPTQIKEGKLKIKLNITEMIVEKDSPQFVVLKIKGNREVKSYDDQAMNKTVIFEDTLTLKRLPRSTKTPWGLLVDNWSESIYKS